MRSRYRLAALSLALLLAVHLQPVYRVRVGGERLEGLYSPAQLRAGRETAHEAAEELLEGPALLPRERRSLRLRLRPADGSVPALSDALLRGTEGLTVADGVRVNGTALGTVDDGQALLEQLLSDIRSGMPAAAAVGNLGGSLEIRPVYARVGRESSTRDMLLRITGAAPVFYLDRDGKLV